MQHLRFANCAPSPWKNGGGITRQLLICPPAANLDDFSLRISVADVDSDGAFSHFAGIDRTLAIVSGQGLDLQLDNKPWQTLLADGSLLPFSGELAISSTRRDGAVRDFNIMTRRSQCRHQAQSLRLHGQQDISHERGLLVFLASGSALQARTSDTQITLDTLDALWLADGGTVSLNAAAPCHIIVMRLVPADVNSGHHD